jgi:hypothetical protein
MWLTYTINLVQIKIINVCCILHNFVLDRQQDMDQLFINQIDNLIPNDHVEGHGEISIITHVHPSNEWNNFSDAKLVKYLRNTKQGVTFNWNEC